MSENTIRHSRGCFTQIPNNLLQDKTLSLEAKAIYCIMYSKPDGWKFFKGQLITESTNGRTSFDNALKELVERGWVEQGGGGQGSDGKWKGYEYVLHENRCIKTATVNPQRENRSGKPATINTDINNTDEVRLIDIPPNPPMGGATTGQTENQQIKKGANNGTKTSFERQFGEITETTIPERPADFGGNPAEWLNFASHHAAKGNRFAGIKGWKLAWQKWNRNAINWGPRGGNNPQPSKFVAIYNQTLARGLEREGVDGRQPPEWLRD